MRKNFSFIVCTYNQENVIIQTLESIKYQTMLYGQDYDITIIISDDGSTDNTVLVIENWIKINRMFFFEIKKNYIKENKGSCFSFVSAIKLVKSDFLLDLAGDDILTCNNIFRILEKNYDNDIIMCNVLQFSNNQVSRDMKSYGNIVKQKYYSYKELKYASEIGECLIQGGHISKKDIYTEDVLKFILKFRLTEDRPLWYILFKKKKVSIVFSEVPSILYRRSINSVTNKENVVLYGIHIDDVLKLYKIAQSNEKSLFKRYIIYCQSQVYKANRGKNFKTNISVWILINPFWIYEIFMKICNKRKINADIIKLFDSEVEKNQIYLNQIIAISESMKKN